MKNKRPTLITILCVLGFIGIIGAILNLFINVESANRYLTPQNFSFGVIIFGLMTIAIYLFFLIKIWKMKKLGVIGYGITALVELIVDAIFLKTPILNLLTSLIIYIIIICILFSQFKKMD